MANASCHGGFKVDLSIRSGGETALSPERDR